jgi:hypothetical protein
MIKNKKYIISVPPDIDDRQTSSDVIVNEGDDADLVSI